jgi:hypothetical protein
VLVAVVDGSLVLTGSEGGSLTIAALDLERVRIGVIAARRVVYSATIWFANGAETIELVPYPNQLAAYRDVMRAFVASLVAQHKGDRIELGTSKLDALLAPVLFGLLAAATLAVAVILRGEPWWGRMLIPALPVTLFVLFTRSTLIRQWPRPMGSVADVEGQLPVLPG